MSEDTLRLTTDQVNRIPHISGIAPQTAKLIEKLKEWKPGVTASDAELSALIGRSTEPSGDGYSNLMSAIRYVMRHYGVIVERVRGTNTIKCLNAHETVTSVQRGREHIGRRARREGQKLHHVNTAELEGPEKTEALVLKAQLGALAAYSSTATAKRLSSSRDLDKWQEQQRKMLKAM